MERELKRTYIIEVRGFDRVSILRIVAETVEEALEKAAAECHIKIEVKV